MISRALVLKMIVGVSLSPGLVSFPGSVSISGPVASVPQAFLRGDPQFLPRKP